MNMIDFFQEVFDLIIGTFQKDAKVVDSLFGETIVLPPEIALKLSTGI